MAQIRFLKEGEPSQKKNYIPNSKKYKRRLLIFQVISIIEVLAIGYLIYLRH